MTSLNGKWMGQFTYGQSYGKTLAGRTINFEMELTCNNDLITGTCIDDESKDIFDQPANITGTFENNTIHFIKEYPSQYFIDEDGKANAMSIESPSILYSGVLKRELFSRSFYFKGEWNISGSYLDEDKVSRYFTLDGTWKMKKGK